MSKLNRLNETSITISGITICLIIAAIPIFYDLINIKSGESFVDVFRKNSLQSTLVFILPTLAILLWKISNTIEGIKSIKDLNDKYIEDLEAIKFEYISKIDSYLESIKPRVDSRIKEIKSIRDNYDDIHQRLESLVVNYNNNRQYEEVCLPEIRKMSKEIFSGEKDIILTISSYMFRAEKSRLDEHREKIIDAVSKIIVEKDLTCKLIISFKKGDYEVIPILAKEIQYRLISLERERRSQEKDKRTYIYISFCNITSHDVLLINDRIFSHYNALEGDGARRGFMMINSEAFETQRLRFNLLLKQNDKIENDIKTKVRGHISESYKGMYKIEMS